jgi:hypothetical protein
VLIFLGLVLGRVREEGGRDGGESGRGKEMEEGRRWEESREEVKGGRKGIRR